MHLKIPLVLLSLVVAASSWAQTPPVSDRPRPRLQPLAGESRVIPRGDLELLTYESEADVQKLEELLAANASATPRPGEFTMNYFRSALDGSVQPYGFRLPTGYDPAGSFPLLVQLHGIGPKALAGRRTIWRGMGVKEWIDPHAPVIVAQPLGRGNTFYQGMGEQDVLEVIADVRRRYPVAPDRIYIMGHSMGGAGSWLVGLHHPDRFGSITPIDAAMGFRDAVDNPEGVPGWLLPQVAAFRPDNLFPNARNVPVFMKNAGAGIQRDSTKFSGGVVAAGGFATMESFPGMPHHFAPQFSYAAFTDMATLLPIQRQPHEVRFYTTTLQYDRAYWVTIDRLERSPANSQVFATYDDGKPKPVAGRRGQPPPPPEPARPPSLAVSTTNIDGLTLRPRDAGIPAGEEVIFAVDGADVATGALPNEIHLEKSEGKWRIVGTAVESGKRCGLQGPVGDAFNSPFLAVYGEGDLPLARAELDAIRNPPSQLVVHAEFPLKAAARVSAEDIARANLVLFGTPASNPILARVAAKLPSDLMKAIGQGSAVVFIHPNPESPGRYVVVWSGPILSVPLEPRLEAGWMLPLNLLPDYLVAKKGRVLSAGHFDRDWKMPAREAP